MARFTYEAKKNPTDIIKGTLVADNRTAAIQKIGQMGYYVVRLEEEGKSPETVIAERTFFSRRVGLKDLTDFTRQLSDLLESGLTIVAALNILETQTTNKRLKRAIADICDTCVGGNSFSHALGRYPDIFSNLYVSMVRSGETGGMLENILKRIADLNEKQLDIQTKVRSAFAYPILMAIVGCATITVLMTFVIPKMMSMFEDLGQALPLPTQILVWISNALVGYWWLIIAAIFIVGASVMKAYRTEEGRLVFDRFKLKIPVMGNLIRKVEIARFSRTLATLLSNGVPILESLKIVSETMSNVVMRQELSKAYSDVRAGASLAKGFYGSRVIPVGVINMIAVGEEGGNLEKSLIKIAQSNERESDEAVKIMMSLLEPILILTLGVIVGFIVISMLLPIFEINFLVR